MAGSITREGAGLLTAFGDKVAVSENRDIIRSGASRHVHVLLSGWAARYETLADGSRQITAFLLPGDICDQQLLLFGTADQAVCALTPASVMRIRREALRQLIEEEPLMARSLWRASLLDASIARAWLVNIGRRESRGRIAHLLCELFVRLKMIGLASDHEVALPLTQAEIADSQGLTSVHVNRVLQQLRADGFLELERHRLKLLRPHELVKLAGFDAAYLHAPPGVKPIS